MRGQVHQHRLGIAMQAFIEVIGDAATPKLVQISPLLGGQACSHFKAVGLHQVQGPQHAVQTAEHAHMRLRPGQRLLIHGAGVQAVIDIAIKGQQRLAGIFFGRARRPGVVTRHVQSGQRVAQIH